jgi:steroid delta-isomerase-like uncharacterized protein
MAETHVEPAGTEVDPSFLDKFRERFGAAWNSHQPERLLELMTEDIVYDDSAWPRTMRGHGDVREFLEFLWRALPDLEFQDLEGPFFSKEAPTVAFYWKGTGTFTGPLDPPGFAPTGARIAFEGFDLLEFRDDRVCRLRIVFDMMDVSRQIGVVPNPGSRVEEAGAAAQRLSVRVRDRLRR